MFVSFFPRPLIFIWSALLWADLRDRLLVLRFGPQLGELLGFHLQATGAQDGWGRPVLVASIPVVLSLLRDGDSDCSRPPGCFLSPHPWSRWSILGSALILFTSYFQVQVSVAINGWYGPFYDLVQAALSKVRSPSRWFNSILQLATFAGIAFVAVTVGVLTRFFVSHYIFRWRTAMNDLLCRELATGSEPSREPPSGFRKMRCDLRRRWKGSGVNLVDAIMTLIAFLPVLVVLSSNVTELPLVGADSLSAGCRGLACGLRLEPGSSRLIGIRLPGLEFHNQRVEAAYRKELVYGEDDSNRASPPRLMELFAAVRQNYFRVYVNYMYFNVGRILVSADRQHLPLYRARTDDRGRQDHARIHEPDSQCVFAGSILVPISRERLASNCRTDFDLQAPAGFRTPHR